MDVGMAKYCATHREHIETSNIQALAGRIVFNFRRPNAQGTCFSPLGLID